MVGTRLGRSVWYPMGGRRGRGAQGGLLSITSIFMGSQDTPFLPSPPPS